MSDKWVLAINEWETAPFQVLNVINYILEKQFKKLKIIPLWISAAILGIIIFLIPFGFAFILGETKQLSEIGWVVFTSLLLSYLSVIVMYFNINKNIFDKLKKDIAPYILLEEDISDLNKCLLYATDRKKTWPILMLSIIIGSIALLGGSITYGNNPGVGLPIAAIFFGIFGGISVYYLLWTLKLTGHLGKYEYLLEEFTPTSSKIIQKISFMLNVNIYIVTGFITSVVIIDTLDRLTLWFIVPDLIFGVIPIIAQFIIMHKSTMDIIARAKWKALDQIQSEIRKLKENGRLQNKETTDSIIQLLDLHDRIFKTSASTLSIKSTFNFISQAILPLIGGLITNHQNVIDSFEHYKKLLENI